MLVITIFQQGTTGVDILLCTVCVLKYLNGKLNVLGIRNPKKKKKKARQKTITNIYNKFGCNMFRYFKILLEFISYLQDLEHYDTCQRDFHNFHML